MFEAKFVIIGVKADGSEFECFRWTRDANSGIQRAYADAKKYKADMVYAYAKSV